MIQASDLSVVTDVLPRNVTEVLDAERAQLAASKVQSRAYTNDPSLINAQRELFRRSSSRSSNPKEVPGTPQELQVDPAHSSIVARFILPLKWVLTALIAVVVALQCGGLIMGSHQLIEWRLHKAAAFSH